MRLGSSECDFLEAHSPVVIPIYSILVIDKLPEHLQIVMRFRPKSPEPLIIVNPISAIKTSRWVKERIDVKSEPVFLTKHAKIVVIAVVLHSILLLLLRLRLDILLLSRASGAVIRHIEIIAGISVADGRHDGNVAVVGIVVRSRNTCEGILKNTSWITPVREAIRLIQ